MRVLHALASLGAAAALSACVYVDRERPVRERLAAVQPVPGGATVVTPGATVAPASPPAAVIVR